METDHLLNLAYDWLDEYKAKSKSSMKTLGEHISYSNSGFTKALKNKTLSLTQIKLIADNEGVIDDFNRAVLSGDILQEDAEDYSSSVKNKVLGVFLRDNHERLMQEDVTYQMFISKLIADVKAGEAKFYAERIQDLMLKMKVE